MCTSQIEKYTNPTMYAVKEGTQKAGGQLMQSQMDAAFNAGAASKPDAVTPPEAANKAVQSAQAEEARQARRRKGLLSTMITGAQGVTGAAPTAKKSLLGL